ncbi:MAG TPA: glutamate 5-kinase [Kofleriaceae bacterium]|nr:glutamate 5-kinase [Kofleriaceae bacterium]
MKEAADPPRAALLAARRVVIKVGSRLLAESPAGRPAAIADEITHLAAARGLQATVVSSGAISLGMKVLRHATRPTELAMLQACAAVGQGRLVQHWEHAFGAHGVTTGQVLLSHDDISNRKRFLNARHALRALIDSAVVPIINENDTVAVDEIKYGDNDLLAALVCNLVSAEALIILTDVEGLRDASGARVPTVRDIDAEAVPVAGGTAPRGVGSGGMASKVQAARVANKSGITCVIVPGRRASIITETLGGDDVGTVFVPPGPVLKSRKHWLAYSSRPTGTLVVDEGARRALVEQGKSLLPAGLLGVEGDFEQGDLVSIVTAERTEFARGLAGYRADELHRIRGARTADIAASLGYKYLDEVIHRDDLVLL